MVLKAIKNITKRVFSYVLNSENPLIQIFYFVIGPLAYAVYFFTVYLKYVDQVGYVVVIIGNLLTWVGLYYYYKAWKTDPGTITNQNYESVVDKYKDYYDGMTFQEDKKCYTCKFQKPARSKHCALCDRCVSVFDHHCPWVRNCIAEKNLVYFIRFIFYHFLFCGYKFCLCAYIIIDQTKILSREFSIKQFSSSSQYTNFMLLLVFNNQFLYFFFLWTAFTTFALYVFFVTLATKFMDKITTNEEFKIESTMEFLEKKLQHINNKIITKKYSKKELEQYQKEVHTCCLWFLKKEKLYSKKNRLRNIIKLVIGTSYTI